ncbi:efflux transporter outer membrane subunit [Roseovarius sp.]|jgi:multidrug efflux system outer membrane protein
MRIIMMIPLGILLAGCAEIGMAHRPLEADLPDRYSVLAPVKAPTREDAEWWRNFNDPVLDQLVMRGMSDNLSVAEARARLREAEANARGANVPVSGNANASVRAPSNVSETSEFSINGQINLAGETGFRSRAAQARLEAAEFNTIEARRTVLSEVAQAYADLRFFQSSRAFRAQDLRSRQRTLTDIETQLGAGAATRLDLLRAQSLLAETRAEIPQLDARIIQTRNRLSTLLGVPVGSLGMDLGYRGQQPMPKGTIDAGVPADLLRARPDIRRAEQVYAAAVSDVGAADAARYPSLNLSGLISAPTNGGSRTETLLAGLVMPVFNQPALLAEKDAASARVEQTYLQWRIAVLDAVEEVENAQTLLTSARKSVAAAREAVTLNRQALDLSRELLSSGGNITVLDVLDRERALSSSRTALAQNTRDVASAFIQLYVALGRGHPLTVDRMPINEDAATVSSRDELSVDLMSFQ